MTKRKTTPINLPNRPTRYSDVRLATVALAAFGPLALGCGPAAFHEVPTLVRPTAGIEATVYFIGDAGDATPELQVLHQLRSDILQRPSDSESVVVFLGDNIYWSGLHPPDHPDHETDVGHLESQIDVLRGTKARGVFIPGNHDWGYGGEQGAQQMRRQEDHLDKVAASGVDVRMLPPAVCPGPALLRVAESILLVAIETDLWLRDQAPAPECRFRSTDEAVAGLREALEANEAGERRYVLVAAHHPLETYGPHGGYFGLKDQFFPGTNLWKPLYIPLPFLYPIARNSGITKQDVSHPRYRAMREQFMAALSAVPGHSLVWAAGHDHNLQVFRGDELGVGYVLVSGAGSRLTQVGHDTALFAAGKQHGELGFMRLEFFDDGRVLLTVITDGTRGCAGSRGCTPEAQIRYQRWLVD